MSQFGENQATGAPPKIDDPVDKKDPLKIRCLLFFDGTLNNRDNITERLKHESGQASQRYLKNRANQNKETKLANGALGVDLEDDSYENDYSNIVHLEANVAPKQKGYDERVKVYVEGAGTLEYEPDWLTDKDGKFILDKYGQRIDRIGDNSDQQSGYAFAAGKSGIKAKVERGIDEAIQRIGIGPNDDDPRDNTNYYLEKLTIDIFGFSRGAASARYCVHRLLKPWEVYDEEFGTYVESTETEIQHRLRTMYWLQVKEVEIRFVGLFDTVVSYKAAQAIKLGGSLENWLVKQTAIKHKLVKKVVHLASAEEHRDQFCLHNIRSAGSKGEEYFLPGVHSDIGGGYLDNSSEAGLKVCQAYPYWARKDRDDYLVARGWYKKDQLFEDVISLDEGGEPDFVEMAVIRNTKIARVVRNAYCKIPLKIMAKKASEDDIAFRYKLINEASNAINAFQELVSLESKINSYISKAGPRGSRATDWQMTDPELNSIRHKHLHFSARYNGKFNGLGHNPRFSFFSFKRKRYVFNG